MCPTFLYCNGDFNMKRTISLILLLLLILSLFGCAKKPVEFSEKLSDGRECYIDVAQIAPKEVMSRNFSFEGSQTITSYYFLCECTTVSDDTVYMLISVYDYKDYIDSSAKTAFGTLPPLPSKAELDQPIKIFGTAINPPDRVGIDSLKRIFEFEYVDGEDTEQ